MRMILPRGGLACVNNAIRPDCGAEAMVSVPTVQALSRWSAGIQAATEADNVLRIFGVIGKDWWDGGGNTVGTVTDRLNEIGNQDVEVHINSPGGDVFEGIAIYNLLKSHSKNVTVKVLGLAASAASIIAMAGNDRLMGEGAFIMIHNAWVVAAGNRHDMRKVADTLEPFDQSLRDIYVSQTSQKAGDIEKWMDEETFLNQSKAVELGFATGTLSKDQVVEDKASTSKAKAFNAARQMEAILTQKAGMTRKQARALIQELSGNKPCAAAETGDTPDAVAPLQPDAEDQEALMAAAALFVSLKF